MFVENEFLPSHALDLFYGNSRIQLYCKKQKSAILYFFPAKHLLIARIQQTASKDNAKFNSASKKRLIRETKAGKNWKNGFIYSTQSQNPRKPKRIYQFDAVTGKLLWITEIYKVTNDNYSH